MLGSWEPVALDTFGDRLPTSIRSGWVFVLRAGTDTGFERHSSSHQRIVTLAGTGDMKTDAKGMPNAVKDESEIVGRSNVLVSDAGATLERRWISIPKNVWHRPVIPRGADWLVVSFHTVPPDCARDRKAHLDLEMSVLPDDFMTSRRYLAVLCGIET
jgi:hypothetical protein